MTDHIQRLKQLVLRGVEGIAPVDGRLSWASVIMSALYNPTPTSPEIRHALDIQHGYAQSDISNTIDMNQEQYLLHLLNLSKLQSEQQEKQTFVDPFFQRIDADSASEALKTLPPPPFALGATSALPSPPKMGALPSPPKMGSALPSSSKSVGKTPSQDTVLQQLRDLEKKLGVYNQSHGVNDTIVKAMGSIWSDLIQNWQQGTLSATTTGRNLAMDRIPHIVSTGSAFLTNPITDHVSSLSEFSHIIASQTAYEKLLFSPSTLSTRDTNASAKSASAMTLAAILPLDRIIVTQLTPLHRHDVLTSDPTTTLTLSGQTNAIAKNHVSLKISPVCDPSVLILVELFKTIILLCEQLSELCYALIRRWNYTLNDTRQSTLDARDSQAKSDADVVWNLLFERYDMLQMTIAMLDVYTVYVGQSDAIPHQSLTLYTGQYMQQFVQRVIREEIADMARGNNTSSTRTTARTNESKKSKSSTSQQTSRTSFNGRFKQDLTEGGIVGDETALSFEAEAVETVPLFLRRHIEHEARWVQAEKQNANARATQSTTLRSSKTQSTATASTARTNTMQFNPFESSYDILDTPRLSIGHLWTTLSLYWTWSIWRLRPLLSQLDENLALNESNRWFVEYLLSTQASHFTTRTMMPLVASQNTIEEDEDGETDFDDNRPPTTRWVDELFSPTVYCTPSLKTCNPILLRIFDSQLITPNAASLYHTQPFLSFSAMSKQVMHQITHNNNTIQETHSETATTPHLALRRERYETLCRHIKLGMRYFVSLCEPVNIGLNEFLLHSPNWNLLMDQDVSFTTLTTIEQHGLSTRSQRLVTAFNALMVQLYLGLRLATVQFGLTLPSFSTTARTTADLSLKRPATNQTPSRRDNDTVVLQIIKFWMPYFAVRTSPAPEAHVLDLFMDHVQEFAGEDANEPAFGAPRRYLESLLRDDTLNITLPDNRKLLSFFQVLNFTPDVRAEHVENFQVPTFGTRAKLVLFEDASANTVVREYRSYCEQDTLELSTRKFDATFGALLEYARQSTRRSKAQLDEMDIKHDAFTEQMNDFVWACKSCLLENQTLALKTRQEMFDHWTFLYNNQSDGILDMVSQFYVNN